MNEYLDPWRPYSQRSRFAATASALGITNGDAKGFGIILGWMLTLGPMA
jgi:hypothetical protein